MSVKFYCDKCGAPIGNTESINVFRMWNLRAAVEITNEGVTHLPFDDDYYICDGCMERLFEGDGE